MASTTRTMVELHEDEIFTNPWRRSLDCPQKAPGGPFAYALKSPLPEPSLELQPRSSTLTFADSTTSTLTNPASPTASLHIDAGDEEARLMTSRRRTLLSLITFSAVYRTCILLLAFASVIIGLLQYLSQIHQPLSSGHQGFCIHRQSCPPPTPKALSASGDEEEAISDSPRLKSRPPIRKNVTFDGGQGHKRRSSWAASSSTESWVRHIQWQLADESLHGIIGDLRSGEDITPPRSDKVHDETNQSDVSDDVHLATTPPPAAASLLPNANLASSDPQPTGSTDNLNKNSSGADREQKEPDSPKSAAAPFPLHGTFPDRASAPVLVEGPRDPKAAKFDECKDSISRNIQTYHQFRGSMLDPQFGVPTTLLQDNISAYPSQELGFNTWASPRYEATSLGRPTLLNLTPSQGCSDVGDLAALVGWCAVVCVVVFLVPIALCVKSGRIAWPSSNRLSRTGKFKFLAALGVALVSWWW